MLCYVITSFDLKNQIIKNLVLLNQNMVMKDLRRELHLKTLKNLLFLVVRLYVGMFELVNYLVVLSILI